MNDDHSNLGHWERINVSANSVVTDAGRLNLPLIVQDVCRALIDLRGSLKPQGCRCHGGGSVCMVCAGRDSAAQPAVRHRDAITGQYVDADEAAARPETTIRETRKP